MAPNQNQPKRHHYVPVSLQRNWLGSSANTLWYLRRMDGTIFRTSPENSFIETHLNSTIEQDGSRDAELEIRYYGMLDDFFSSCTRTIIQSILAGNRVRLSNRTRLDLLKVLMFSYRKRHPQAFSFLLDKASINSQIEKVLTSLEAPDEEKKRFLDEISDESGFNRFKNNLVVGARPLHHPQLEEWISEFGVEIGFIDQEQRTFIISDAYCDMDHPTKKAIYSQTFWFPIHPKIALRPIRGTLITEITRLGRNEVRRINENLYSRSEIVGSASSRLLQSLKTAIGFN